jgi:hypothetical protein
MKNNGLSQLFYISKCNILAAGTVILVDAAKASKTNKGERK